MPDLAYQQLPDVSTHAPLTRCDQYDLYMEIQSFSFYSRTSYEVRQCWSAYPVLFRWFLLTHLLRGATCLDVSQGATWSFLLTHLLRGATAKKLDIDPVPYVSTHAPLTRCDQGIYGDFTEMPVSTHAPLTRCDQESMQTRYFRRCFYSRTSYEVRHQEGHHRKSNESFLLTHLLRGATLFSLFFTFRNRVSTHAPLTRCDWKFSRK